MGYPPRDPHARLAKFLSITPAGCWRFNGKKTWMGYGRFWYQGRTVMAHRFTWEQIHGPVPDGLELDHLCRVRDCVNPDHLEAVTHQENQRRGPGRVTHCKHGHPLSGPNLYVCPRGRRECRTCRTEAAARHKARSYNKIGS